MRFKVVKVIFAVFVALICFGFLISARYYVKTVQSFKTFFNEEEVKLTSMQNDCYKELKKSLDDKYTKKFIEIIEKKRKNFFQKNNITILLNLITLYIVIALKKYLYLVSLDHLFELYTI